MPHRTGPALTMSDIYGPGHFFFARAIDGFCDWLPSAPAVLDSLTGGQLTIAGDLPVVCSQGFGTAAARELIALGGLDLAPSQVRYRAGDELAALAKAAAEYGGTVVMQHAWPPAALGGVQPWIGLDLLQYLNDKANLAELVQAAHCPPRDVVDRAAFFDREDCRLPLVLKVVTDQSNGGGCGVMICRTAEDLREAAAFFGRCDRIVVEEMLEIARNPCLNFAVMPDGEARYLGFADQDLTSEGKYRGNWMDFDAPIPQSAVEIALEPVRRGAAMGYRGVAGVDLAFTADGSVYALDLNFRLNGCTPMILLAERVRARTAAKVIHFRKLQGALGAVELVAALNPYVVSGRVIPLSLFDPMAAGYGEEPASAQALIVGASRGEVLAAEAEIEEALG